MNIIAERISKRRKELGLTQKDLAEKLNVSDKTLSRWETGKQIPDALTIPEIAKMLDISINELYGVTCEESHTTTSAEIMDDRRINSYKVTSAFSGLMFLIGYVLYSQTGSYWHYMKVGATLLLAISIFLFLVSEITFEEFYRKTMRANEYEMIHDKWFGIVVPITGLIAGIIIPVFKAPVIIIVNSWDVMFPLAVYQSIVLAFYIKRHLYNRAEGIENKNFIIIYIFASLAILCSIIFIVSVLSNPYHNALSYDVQANNILQKIKYYELAAGSMFFLMNIFYSKRILNICENSFKNVMKYFVIIAAAIAAVITLIVGIVNHNLNAKVSYHINEVPMYELTNYDRSIWEWIQECNISGKEINLLSVYRYDAENENEVYCYLIYLPHGYQDTKFKARYHLGTNGKVMELEFKNTTQIMDDNYYLCYVEVVNNMESFELHTYLDGEEVRYYDQGDGDAVAAYRRLNEM